MSTILDSLGLDEETFEWHDLALCNNTEREWFFDDYESDPIVAENVDQMCLSCPVVKQCLQYGTETKQYGVWGGVYLNSGAKDNARNAHKSPEFWKLLQARIAGVD